jgi:hypothetical protein
MKLPPGRATLLKLNKICISEAIHHTLIIFKIHFQQKRSFMKYPPAGPPWRLRRTDCAGTRRKTGRGRRCTCRTWGSML